MDAKSMRDQGIENRFEFRGIRPGEADAAIAIETLCFPPNEACTPPRMRARIAAASDTFLVAIDRERGRMAGFINGIATNELLFRDEFFTDTALHDPRGRVLMILGLDVHPDYRNRGLARALVRACCRREREKGREILVLTCHENLVAMYRKMGFEDMGMSGSAWGGERWHEMRRPLA